MPAPHIGNVIQMTVAYLCSAPTRVLRPQRRRRRRRKLPVLGTVVTRPCRVHLCVPRGGGGRSLPRSLRAAVCRPSIEPLLLNGQLHAEDTSTSRSTAALNAVPLSKDLLMPVRPAWGNLVLCLIGGHRYARSVAPHSPRPSSGTNLSRRSTCSATSSARRAAPLCAPPSAGIRACAP